MMSLFAAALCQMHLKGLELINLYIDFIWHHTFCVNIEMRYLNVNQYKTKCYADIKNFVIYPEKHFKKVARTRKPW